MRRDTEASYERARQQRLPERPASAESWRAIRERLFGPRGPQRCPPTCLPCKRPTEILTFEEWKARKAAAAAGPAAPSVDPVEAEERKAIQEEP